MRELLASILRDEQIADSGTVALADLWERYKRDAVMFLDNHEKTRKGDTTRAKVLIGFFGEDCDVSKLTENDQLAFINKRLAGGIKYGDDEVTDPVRLRSIQADLKLLHTILKWATTVRVRGGRRLLDQNPLAGIKKPREKNPRRPVATWERFQATRTAIRKLVAESKTDSDRRKWLKLDMALVLAESTGRRMGSIRQLAWADIDFSASSILWRADTDKKGKAWRIPMTAELRDELKSFRVALGGAFGGLVFQSEKNASDPIRTDVFSKWLLAAETKADLPKLDGSLFHAYRRSWASARKSLPVMDVAAAGGWSDLTTLLNCYQQVDEDTLLAVMNESKKVTERTKNA